MAINMGSIGLKRSLKAGSKKKLKKNKLPKKREMNLAVVELERINWLIGIPAIILILVLAGVFSKAAVLDRLDQVAKANAKVNSVTRTFEAKKKELDKIGDITEEYAHLTYSGMTKTELSQTDRMEVLKMVERIVLPKSSVEALSLTGNELEVQIKSNTLQEINELVKLFEKEELVSYCSVTTAATKEEKTGNSKSTAVASASEKNTGKTAADSKAKAKAAAAAATGSGTKVKKVVAQLTIHLNANTAYEGLKEKEK